MRARGGVLSASAVVALASSLLLAALIAFALGRLSGPETTGMPGAARSAAAQRWLAHVCPGGCSEQSGGKPCHRILYARVYLCRPYAEPLPVT